MRMKKRYDTISIVLLVLSMLLAGCQQDDSADQISRVPIRLSTSIGTEEGVTRASLQAYLINEGLNFSNGQNIALFICESDGTNDIDVTEENQTKLTYQGQQIATTTQTDGSSYFTLTYNDGLTRYWPDTNNRLSFYAWYPASAFSGLTVDATPVITIPVDQSTDAAYAAKDLMMASLTHQVRTPDAQTLNFSHSLSKVIVILKSTNGSISEDLMNNASVKLLKGDAETSILLDAEVNLKTGTATAVSDGTSTEEFTIGTGKNTFAVLPTMQSLVNKKISVTMNGKEQSYAITSITNLLAGKKYTFTIDLISARQDFAGTLSVSVSDWNNPAEGQDLVDQRLTL